MSGFRLGIFGGASEGFDDHALDLSARVGAFAAKLGIMLVTGATHGIPHAAGKAALSAGGVVLGISPARNAEEHVETFGKPLDGATHIFWTGLGYTGRNFLNLRNCDASIFIGGGAGTLEKFCIAVYEGQVIGGLKNSGGIAAMLPQITDCFKNHHGSVFIYDTEPEKLVLDIAARMSGRKLRAAA